MLNRCDDAAEFDDSIDAEQNFDDDPSIVVFRKANKIGFFVTVTPKHEDNIKVLLYFYILCVITGTYSDYVWHNTVSTAKESWREIICTVNARAGF